MKESEKTTSNNHYYIKLEENSFSSDRHPDFRLELINKNDADELIKDWQDEFQNIMKYKSKDVFSFPTLLITDNHLYYLQYKFCFSEQDFNTLLFENDYNISNLFPIASKCLSGSRKEELIMHFNNIRLGKYEIAKMYEETEPYKENGIWKADVVVKSGWETH